MKLKQFLASKTELEREVWLKTAMRVALDTDNAELSTILLCDDGYVEAQLEAGPARSQRHKRFALLTEFLEVYSLLAASDKQRSTKLLERMIELACKTTYFSLEELAVGCNLNAIRHSSPTLWN